MLNALEALFVWIRAYPEEEKFKEVLIIFKVELSKREKMEYVTLMNIINRIKSINQFKYKKYLISILSRVIVKGKINDLGYIRKSKEVLIEILDNLIKKYENNEFEKIETMSSAVHNYPGFLLGNYKCKPFEFWKDHIGFYKRVWKEDFLSRWAFMFEE